MAWGVDEVDEETGAVFALLDEVQIILGQLVEERDGPAGRQGTQTLSWAFRDAPHIWGTLYVLASGKQTKAQHLAQVIVTDARRRLAVNTSKVGAWHDSCHLPMKPLPCNLGHGQPFRYIPTLAPPRFNLLGALSDTHHRPMHPPFVCP